MIQYVTPQEAYDNIVAHFNKDDAQFGKDFEEYGSCVYRGYGDPHSKVQCAFGVQLRDSEYDEDMEGRSVQDVILQFGLTRFDNEPVREFLRKSQHLHDSMAGGYDPLWDTTGAHRLSNEKWTTRQFVQVLSILAKEYGVEV
jgi:hypothetical protein